MDEEDIHYGAYFSYLEDNDEDDYEDDEDDTEPIYTCASDIYNDILKYRPDTEIMMCVESDNVFELTIKWHDMTHEIHNYCGYPDFEHFLIEDNGERSWGWSMDVETFCKYHLCE